MRDRGVKWTKRVVVCILHALVPSVFYSKELYFDIYLEGTELDVLLPALLSVSLSYNQMSFAPKVESDRKTPLYLHRSIRKVIPIPVLEIHERHCTCINLQGFLSLAWKQHLLWHPGHQ